MNLSSCAACVVQLDTVHLNHFVHIICGQHQALYGAHLLLSRRCECERRTIELSMKLGSALSNWR